MIDLISFEQKINLIQKNNDNIFCKKNKKLLLEILNRLNSNHLDYFLDSRSRTGFWEWEPEQYLICQISRKNCFMFVDDKIYYFQSVTATEKITISQNEVQFGFIIERINQHLAEAVSGD